MDTGFDQNKAKLGIFILAIPFQVFTYGDGLEEVRFRTRKMDH